jgi:hypothetical protein
MNNFTNNYTILLYKWVYSVIVRTNTYYRIYFTDFGN